TFWWAVVIAGYAALAVFITVQTEKQLKSLFESSPLFANLIGNLGGSNADFNASLLGFFWVMFAALLMAFAVTQASRWAADEEEGLQELVLSTPQPRLTVILAQFGALATATVIIGVVTLALSALAVAVTGLA